MVQPAILGAFSRPQLINLRAETEPLTRLPKPLAQDLLWRLTNLGDRDDHTDGGIPAGSHMRNVLDDMLTFGRDKPGHWACTLWPVNSQFGGPVAWSHLEPVPYRADAIQVGFYCGPAWRRRGLGRLLVNECTRLAHRLGYRRLVAHPWNFRSHAFFLGAGFTTVSMYCGAYSGLSELEVPQALPPRPRMACTVPEI